MKMTTLGLIAAAVFATTLSPITSAGNRSQNDSHDQGQRMESRQHGQYQGASRHGRKHAEKRHGRRQHADRGHGQRQGNRQSRRHYGHSSHWNWYTSGRHTSRHDRYRRHRAYGWRSHNTVVLRHHIHGNPVPAIAGGIIGGAIAHEVSGGDQAATFIGAALGAVIVSDASNRRHHR